MFVMLESVSASFRTEFFPKVGENFHCLWSLLGWLACQRWMLTVISMQHGYTAQCLHSLILVPILFEGVKVISTLQAEMFGRTDFWLETRVIIKILKNPCYPMNFDWFSLGWSKKKFFFWKTKLKLPDSKKVCFSKSPILKNFCEYFMDWSLG